MSLYTQQNGINAARNHIDDQYDSKVVFRFKPLQGVQDGTNTVFQIPQQRLVNITGYNGRNLFPQIYKNNAPLVFNTDYTLLSAKDGTIEFETAPTASDSLDATFNWSWMDDIEWDHHLNRAANEIGYTLYYTSPSSIPNTESLPPNGTMPADIPDPLFNAICYLGASYVAKALSARFATRYDTSAGDKSFSPSQMSEAFSEMSDKYEKRAYTIRDDYYKGQGRQYRPAIAQQGYVLPEVSPPR